MMPQRKPITHAYQRIAAQLERGIHEGVLVPGQRLPSIRDLAGQHAVADNTAREAYRALAAAGLVEITTHGTRVAEKRTVSAPLERLGRITAGAPLLRAGEHAVITSAHLEPDVPDHVAGILELEPGQSAICREYVVYDRDDEPITSGVSWFRPELAAGVPQLLLAEALEGGALGVIREATGRSAQLSTLAEARAATVREARDLELERGGETVLVIITTCGDDQGVLEYAEHAHPAGRRVAVGRQE